MTWVLSMDRCSPLALVPLCRTVWGGPMLGLGRTVRPGRRCPPVAIMGLRLRGACVEGILVLGPPLIELSLPPFSHQCGTFGKVSVSSASGISPAWRGISWVAPESSLTPEMRAVMLFVWHVVVAIRVGPGLQPRGSGVMSDHLWHTPNNLSVCVQITLLSIAFVLQSGPSNLSGTGRAKIF